MQERQPPRPQRLYSDAEERGIIADHIRHQAGQNGDLNILEAGCGTRWVLRRHLADVPYTLTGVDSNQDALDVRTNKRQDLDVAIHGDLRTVELKPSTYDIIYNSFVLEHVDGAQVVLERFIDWLKPNGILILRIPNRDSVIGFITRITPFWLHVAYKKHIGKHPYAGKPGHDPFPTFFDRVVSEEGIYDFCETHNLTVKAYYYHSWYKKPGFQPSRFLSRVLVQIVHVLSFKRLTNTRESLIWIIEKPAS